MTKPVIDPSQLTEEQREKIREKFTAIIYLNQIGFQDKLDLLEWLFGKSMFEKGETSLCDTCMHESHGYCKLYLNDDGALMPTYYHESCEDYKERRMTMEAKELRWPDVDCDASISISTAPKSAPEKAVIEGKICRTMVWNKEKNTNLWLTIKSPKDENGNSIITEIPIPHEFFPSITWESEPRKVRIEITLINE